MILLVSDFLPFYVCGVAELALGAVHPRRHEQLTQPRCLDSLCIRDHAQ